MKNRTSLVTLLSPLRRFRNTNIAATSCKSGTTALKRDARGAHEKQMLGEKALQRNNLWEK